MACRVMRSGYPSALFYERLADWRSVRWQVMNRGGARTEKLSFDFTVDRVHWAIHGFVPE